MTSTTGRSSPPSAPPGCRFANSASVNRRCLATASASASPSASVAAVDDVGATKCPSPASSIRPSRSATVLSRTRLFSSPRSPPVIEMIGSPSWCRIAASPTTSSVSPEKDSAMTVSHDRNRPRSPCAASDGCTECAGTPSDDSVAAIFPPISPLLPSPVTSTVPPDSAHRSSSATASPNSSPSASATRPIAAPSARSTSAPNARTSSRPEPMAKGTLPPMPPPATLWGPSSPGQSHGWTYQ